VAAARPDSLNNPITVGDNSKVCPPSQRLNVSPYLLIVAILGPFSRHLRPVKKFWKFVFKLSRCQSLRWWSLAQIWQVDMECCGIFRSCWHRRRI